MSALFSGPAADFDHPIDILDGCHERIRRYGMTIVRLASHLESKGADAQARAAAAGVVRYFDTAGADHHRDEEDDLFPALTRYVSSQELNALFDLLHRLRADHVRLDVLWQDMRTRLCAVVEGHANTLDATVAAGFGEAYEGHIALEEAELLPLARRVLDDDLLHALGARMARRRGVALQR